MRKVMLFAGIKYGYVKIIHSNAADILVFHLDRDVSKEKAKDAANCDDEGVEAPIIRQISIIP